MSNTPDAVEKHPSPPAPSRAHNGAAAAAAGGAPPGDGRRQSILRRRRSSAAVTGPSPAAAAAASAAAAAKRAGVEPRTGGGGGGGGGLDAMWVEENGEASDLSPAAASASSAHASPRGGAARTTLLPRLVDVAAAPAPPTAPPVVSARADYRLIVAVACGMTLSAGYLNVVALLETGERMTHATGAASKLAASVFLRDEADAGRMLLLLCPFFAGAAGAGAVVGSGAFALRPAHAACFAAAAALVAVGAAWVKAGGGYSGLALWAAAAGMQNALCTSFTGAAVRTTHVTGMLTDIGLCTGQWLRRRWRGSEVEAAPDTWKLGILVPQFACFILGGALGAAAHGWTGVDAAYAASAVLLCASLVGLLRCSRQAETGVVREGMPRGLSMRTRKASIV